MTAIIAIKINSQLREWGETLDQADPSGACRRTAPNVRPWPDFCSNAIGRE
jgi:hypothetical protein